MLRTKKDKDKKKAKGKGKAKAAPAPAPTGPVSLVITDAEIVRAQGDHVDRLRIDAVTAVLVRATADAASEADLDWVLEHAAGAMVVPGAADGADELIGRLSRLDGFDDHAAVQAAAGGVGTTFDAWRLAEAG